MELSFNQISPKPDPVHGKPCRRSSHGVSILNNGSVLVLYGGEHVARTPLDDKESLWFAVKQDDDNDNWQWQCILPTGTKPPARVAHAQAAVGDRTVYVFGGRAGITMKEKAMNDLYQLDITTRQWKAIETKGGTPPVPRSFHRMISIDNFLYVFGGCGEQGRMADLHQLNLTTLTWSSLGTSRLLRGRGGPNLLKLQNDQLAVVAGFAGEETNDGHVFSLKSNEWAPKLIEGLADMRPRSVNVAASACKGCIIFGGEVDPSSKGHEGAGGFTNDVVILDSATGNHVQSILAPADSTSWPETRGWSDGSLLEQSDGSASFFIFGGLSGDDSDPVRLDDLWRLDISFS
mmetsp:Transcript_2158/g.3290  ORF Transcript_2158/g.3290 Transcript_2158/m.3290 type:complete len:347 (-) Transcript_2158:136-1176(-)|eukprot:CAMPEP_0194255734 /NCGR_PEP_ID=MMETSP0158-20130606/35152_1 /TAXON_ID=33649 /ORGANISM="Thalassionema nitzschioides, Strain L26-B" /LENGTH=346 /DNA_ID=CAMNT_0038994187 /DNA_START=262 /DNA_END=1302 /DNA_ORIENTATION=+